MYRNYFMDGRYYNIFGAPSGTENIGEFRVDNNNGVIVLDNGFKYDYIILEYANSWRQDGADVMIPVQVSEAIIAWMAWMDIRSRANSRRVNNGEKLNRRREYYNQKRLARREMRASRMWEMNDVIRTNNRLVAKA
jgi:hypothetical protein